MQSTSRQLSARKVTIEASVPFVEGGDFLIASRHGEVATSAAHQFEAWSGLPRLKGLRDMESCLRECSPSTASEHPGRPFRSPSTAAILLTCPKVIIVLLIAMTFDAKPVRIERFDRLVFPHVFRVHNCETRLITLTRLFLMLFDCFLDTSGETSAAARMCFPLAFHCQSQSPQTLCSHRHSSGEHLRCCNCTYDAGSRSRSIKLRT